MRQTGWTGSLAECTEDWKAT